MLTLEMQGQSLLMDGHVPFDSFSIRVMDPVQPFLRSVPDFSFLVSQHGLPTWREMHNVGRKIPVPQAIVGAASRQRIALFAFLQRFPRLLVSQLGAYPSHCNWKIDRLRQIIVGP